MSVDMRENNSNIQSNIFMALMLVTFSTFYLIFLTMEGMYVRIKKGEVKESKFQKNDII